MENPLCPKCEAKTWKIGRSSAGRQCYRCKECSFSFNERYGTPFHHLRKDESTVTFSVVLYAKYPLSTRQVSEILAFNGEDVSHNAIFEWSQKFAEHVPNIKKHYKVKFTKVWHVDEKFVPHKRVPDKKYKRGRKKFSYQITVLDSKGKVVASYLAPQRSKKAIKVALSRAKNTSQARPDIVVTDGFSAYQKGVKVLGRGVRHIVAHFKAELYAHKGVIYSLSNNIIERYHSGLAPKVRSMRGAKNLVKADKFFQLWNFFYNLPRRESSKRLRLGEFREMFYLK